MRTYGFLTVSDILQTRKGAGNWYDGYDDDDDRAFKLPSKYKESAGNQTTEIFLFLFIFFCLYCSESSRSLVNSSRGKSPARSP